jgi:hypothetical protein
MTRDELRAKAIFTLAAANFDYQKPAHARAFSELPAAIRLMLVEKMTAAFDALGAAGFHVLGPEVTEEMSRANGELPHNVGTGGRFVAMARTGDLTRKP